MAAMPPPPFLFSLPLSRHSRATALPLWQTKKARQAQSPASRIKSYKVSRITTALCALQANSDLALLTGYISP